MRFAHRCCLLCKTCARHSAQPKKTPVLHICYFMLHPKRWSIEYVFSAQSTDNLHWRTCALSKGTTHNLFNAQCTICSMHSAQLVQCTVHTTQKRVPAPTQCASLLHWLPSASTLLLLANHLLPDIWHSLRIFLRNRKHSNISSMWYVGRSLIQFDR